jgi:hypothetical protein
MADISVDVCVHMATSSSALMEFKRQTTILMARLSWSEGTAKRAAVGEFFIERTLTWNSEMRTN